MPLTFRRLFALLLIGGLLTAGANQFDQTHALAQENSDAPTTNSLKLDIGATSAGDSSSGESGAEDSVETKDEKTLEEQLELPPEVIEKGKKAKNEFLEVRAELDQALIEMRATHTRYINDEDRSDAAKDLYREQRTKARRLMDKLFDVGLKVVRWVPDEEAARYLVTMVQYRVDRDFYDTSTLEAGARLIDDFSTRMVYVFRATARSAIVVGDFQLARKLYESMEEKHLEDIDKAFIINATELETQFKKEMEARKVDEEKQTNPRVRMVTTRGDVVMELYIDQAPSAVSNFIQLIENEAYYDKLDFYQVVKGLLALTGDISGNGTGNTGKFLVDECNREDARQPLAGSLVMAKSPVGDTGRFLENSSSSQFAILYVPIPKILGQQVVFGRVIEGMDSLCSLRRVDPSKKKKKGEIQLPPDYIISMEVIRRPDTLPEPEYVDLSNLDPHAGHDHAPGAHPAGK